MKGRPTKNGGVVKEDDLKVGSPPPKGTELVTARWPRKVKYKFTDYETIRAVGFVRKFTNEITPPLQDKQEQRCIEHLAMVRLLLELQREVMT